MAKGRPEKDIPVDAPAKGLAEALRQFRANAGMPSYRVLGPLVYLSHNALSKTASGCYVRWDRVERYITALNRHRPGTVTDDDMKLLRYLQQAAHEAHHALDDVEPDTTRPGPDKGHELLWKEVESSLESSAWEAAHTRAEGAWHVTWLTQRRPVATFECVHDLLACLHDIAEAAGPVRHQEMYGTHLPLTDVSPLPGTEISAAERDVLAGRTAPDLNVVMDILKRCGGTDGDCLAWQGAWNRVTRQSSCQHTTRPRPDLKDTLELARITDADAGAPVRPGIWRRFTKLVRGF